MDHPFYIISSGVESSNSNSPNTSLSGSSHDTSSARYHIQDVKAFAEDLNQAAKSAFPNRGRSRYDTVNACLIRWEQDELNVHPELNRLNNKFKDYGFAANTWLVPSRDSHLELMSKTIDLIRASDNDRNLFIIYYAGHGRINSARQAEWTCNQDPNYASVDWSAIQSLFAKAKSDVLILLDTCAAASSTMRSQYGVMEAIVACGFESRAAPPGQYSFTNTLIEVLDDWQNKSSFSASSLHAEILFQLKLKENRKGREGVKLEWCSTPIHINYTHNSKTQGIELCRRNSLPPPADSIPSESLPDRRSTFIDPMDIDVDDTHTTPSPILSTSASGEFQTPHVLIRIGLEQQQPPMDVKECLRWLESVPILGKWATIEGIYPSYSTLLIISVPIVIWNMLPDNPACSFIGYVTAPSFTRAFLKPNTSKTSNITAADPGGSDSFKSRKIERRGDSYTPLPDSTPSNPKGQQGYLEPRPPPSPPTSALVLNKPQDFRHVGITADYDKKIHTTKIDKSHLGHEQRAPDRRESVGDDAVSPKLIAAIVEKIKKEIVEKIKKEIVEELKQRGSGKDLSRGLPLHRVPSNGSNITSSPPTSALRVYTRPSSPTQSKLSEYPEDYVFTAWRKNFHLTGLYHKS